MNTILSASKQGVFALAALLMWSVEVCAQEKFEQTTCGNAPIYDDKRDYRDRSTAAKRFSIEDNKLYHINPAARRISAGEYSRSVMSDLDWTLTRFPNHPAALELLIRYVLAGGKIYEFSQAECYFQWAHEFAPDDDKMLLAEGYFHWRRSNLQRAIRSYESVLEIDPNSAVAHYNLGLVYIELNDYEQALKHAQAAYAQSYPLSGLRDKLKAVGRDIPAVPVVGSGPN